MNRRDDLHPDDSSAWSGSEPDPMTEDQRQEREAEENYGDRDPNPGEIQLAAEIVHHVEECFDRSRAGWHGITIGFDVKKPNTPYNLEIVADLVNEKLDDVQATHVPALLKDGIQIETFEDEGPDMTWNMED